MSSDRTDLDVCAVRQRVRAVLPAGRVRFALHEPWLGEGEQQSVLACLTGGWVSTAGPQVEQFERALARVAGVRHAVATNSGTAALHIALLCAGVGAADEVLLPSLTFVATANAIRYCGATPHFVDASPHTLCIDPDALEAHLGRTAEQRSGACFNRETGRRIAALVAVHVLGHPAPLEPLRELAGRYRFELVQDAAAALGSLYRDRPVCADARLAILSFNGNKIVTTGGGGALLTDDAELAKRARHRAHTARLPHRFRIAHDDVGFNYAMPSLNAALGLAQLERLEESIERKRRLAVAYARALAGVRGIAFLTEAADVRSNHWLCAASLDDAGALDALLEELHASGVLARALWEPLHRLPMYASAPRASLETTDRVVGRVVCLPSSAFLAPEKDA